MTVFESAGVQFVIADEIATLSFHEGMTSMVHVALALLLAVTGNNTDARGDYDAACARAAHEKKPLLVLVGADWCAACQIMKRETLEPMAGSGELSDVIVTVVDKDARPELAEQLMRGTTLPQVVVFTQDEKGWKRFSLTGMQSPNRIRELLRRAKEPNRG
jgi:thiol:disulfide interchange protein